MSELDELERDLMQAADTWFAQALHQKLQRLIQIARSGAQKPLDADDVQNALMKLSEADRREIAEDLKEGGRKGPNLREAVAAQSQLQFDAEHDLGV